MCITADAYDMCRKGDLLCVINYRNILVYTNTVLTNFKKKVSPSRGGKNLN